MRSRELHLEDLSFVLRVSLVEGEFGVLFEHPPNAFGALERLVRRVRAIHQSIEIPDVRDEPEWIDAGWVTQTGCRGVVATSRGTEVIVIGFREPIGRVPESILRTLVHLVSAVSQPRVPSAPDAEPWRGISPLHLAAMRRLEFALQTDARVWIEGEPGTGRERAARQIAAHRKAAWSVAMKGEVPDTPIVIGTRELRENLNTEVRLSVCEVEIHFAPLRHRLEDIDVFVDAWAPELTARQREWLHLQPWPGNIAELRWVLWRFTHLGLPLHATDVMTEASIRALEKRNLEAALQVSNGKIYGEDGAASLLGLAGSTFASRLKAFDIKR